MNIRRIVSTTIKELQQMSRDKKLYPLLFFAPVIQLVILGYAATLDIHNISTAVLDRDTTQMSRIYLHRFQHNGYFNISLPCCRPQPTLPSARPGKNQNSNRNPRRFRKEIKTGKTFSRSNDYRRNRIKFCHHSSQLRQNDLRNFFLKADYGTYRPSLLSVR